MASRKPIVAGQFYPLRKDECISEIEEMLMEIEFSSALPADIVGGIVPHAGWFFSGKLALEVFQAIKKKVQNVDTFLIFGTAHGYFGDIPAVFDKGSWQTPLGAVDIDEELADILIRKEAVVSDPGAHRYEHSIEVNIPIIQYLFKGAKIVPVITSPNENALTLGDAAGEVIKEAKSKRIICIGSTDLTHYGPGYGFEPQGSGDDAISWASDVNDQKFVDLALELKPAQLLETSLKSHNACGPGAAAAVISAARKLGKTKGVLLHKTNSNDIMKRKMARDSEESVGYASIIY